jgi:leader peptidase (prepilin peptidase)/N-methyltransferase
MNTNGLLVTSGFLTSGLLAGHAARRLLARLRRGAVFRPPACELCAAMASAIVGWRLAVGALPAWWFAVPLLLGWLAVPLAAVDLSVLRLPNALTYAAYPILGIALTVAAACGPDHGIAVRALLGTAVLGGAHAVLRWFAPTALGAGDAKLAGSLGAVLGALGWQTLILATAVGATITLLLALTPLAHPRPTKHLRSTSTKPTSTPRISTRPTAVPPTPAPPMSGSSASSQPTHESPPLTQPPNAPLTQPTNHPLTETPTPAKEHSPPEPITLTSAESLTPAPARIPLLRRAVPHGPGLLIATWLLATFPGQALIGGVTS